MKNLELDIYEASDLHNSLSKEISATISIISGRNVLPMDSTFMKSLKNKANRLDSLRIKIEKAFPALESFRVHF